MSLKDDFEREFSTNPFPFKRVVGDFKELVYQEFIKAPEKKDFYKCLKMFLSDENINKLERENDDNVPIINSEDRPKSIPVPAARFITPTKYCTARNNLFYWWIDQPIEDMPVCAKTNDLTKTEIFLSLTKVQNIIKDFQSLRHYDHEKGNLHILSENTGKSILSEINKIQYKHLADSIINYIINETENTTITISTLCELITDGPKCNKELLLERYREAKMYLNNYLNVHATLNHSSDLDSCFENATAKQKCLEVFEKTGLYSNGRPVILGKKDAGKLGGVLDALNQTRGIFKGSQAMSIPKLLEIFNPIFQTNYTEYKRGKSAKGYHINRKAAIDILK
jgi:hypothetical protein